MTKKDLKNKVTDIQRMGELELNKFEEVLCLSELCKEKKDELFREIRARRGQLKDIHLAIVVMEVLDEMDEDEL